MEPIRVLITGAGSAVGQGIFKALRLSKLPLELVSADISPYAATLYRADGAVIIPKVEDAGSLEKMIATIKEQRIQVVMVGSEFDLEFFACHKNNIESETGLNIMWRQMQLSRCDFPPPNKTR